MDVILKDSASFCYDAYVLRISEDPRNSGFLTVVPAKTTMICAVYDYTGRADPGKGHWNPKRKLGIK